MDVPAPESDAAPGGAQVRATALAAAFALTGVGTGILGALLPAMLRQWQLSDQRGGLLLFLAWAGSTSGALLCGQRLQRSAARGLLLAAVGLVALVFAGRDVAMLFFVPYGVGLGIAMTSISVLRGNEVMGAQRRRVLNRLNMLWAIGACASPSLAARALEKGEVRGVFVGFAAALAAVAVVVLTSGGRDAESGCEPVGAVGASGGAIPLVFCAMAALAVGVESSLGGWLTTYAGRSHHGEALAVSGTTAFWAGLLLSRAAHSLPGAKWLQARGAVWMHVGFVAVAVGVLLGAPGSRWFLPMALLAGLGLGPLYPYALSVVLPRYTSRVIFLVAGLGGAVLPWMTGAVSQGFGSLRVGLVVPMVGVGVLVVVVGLVERRVAGEGKALSVGSV